MVIPNNFSIPIKIIYLYLKIIITNIKCLHQFMNHIFIVYIIYIIEISVVIIIYVINLYMLFIFIVYLLELILYLQIHIFKIKVII